MSTNGHGNGSTQARTMLVAASMSAPPAESGTGDGGGRGRIVNSIWDLHGWKAIADAVGRTENWCRAMADESVPENQRMPVHYVGGRVFARSGAIRAWLLRISGLSESE